MSEPINAVAVRQDALLVRAIDLLRIMAQFKCSWCSSWRNEGAHFPNCELRAILDEWDKMQGKEKP